MNAITERKGVYYFQSHRLAEQWAQVHEYPSCRILKFGLGWAIQWCKSGVYAPERGPVDGNGNRCWRIANA